MAIATVESKSDKQKRIKALKWEAMLKILNDARWIIGILVTVLFGIFLFINEQSEVSGPKKAYPVLYYVAVTNAFILGIILIMFLHAKAWGDIKTTTTDFVLEKLEAAEEVQHDDPEYKEMLEDI